MNCAKMGRSFEIISDFFVSFRDGAYICNVTQLCAGFGSSIQISKADNGLYPFVDVACHVGVGT